MKIFEKDEKVNFVDENNVFVGYDLSQSCCEQAGWFISDIPSTEERENEFEGDLTDYRFDTTFFEEEPEGFDGDSGGMVRFKLIAENKKPLYLQIFNSQNGYYGHGFDATINGQDWQSGRL